MFSQMKNNSFSSQRRSAEALPYGPDTKEELEKMIKSCFEHKYGPRELTLDRDRFFV